MGKFNKKDLNIGDYIYIATVDGYKVSRITEIIEKTEKTGCEIQIWGYFSATRHSNLPETIEEFEAIAKYSSCEFVDINYVKGVLPFEKPALEVGNYVYYLVENEYRVGRITKIIKPSIKESSKIGICGHWSLHLVKQLPKTVEEFNAMDKFEDESKRVNLDVTFERLWLKGEGSTVNVNSLNFLDKFLDITNYESSTIMSLNEILGDGYDIEDVLKILSHNVGKIASI